MSLNAPTRRLAPAAGLEVVSTPDGLVLATATGVLRLDGGVAAAVLERLLPELERRPTVAELQVRLRDLPGDELTRIVDRLITAGLVSEIPGSDEPVPPGWLELITSDLGARQALAHRLSRVRLLLIGDEPATAILRRTFSELGIRQQEVIRPGGLVKDDLIGLLSGCDLVLTVADPGFAAVRAWVNQASLATEVPSIHVALEGTEARVGPMVLPGEGPCYLCWRMRALACADDFDLAMAREENLDRARAPLHRPILPGLVESVAGLLTREVVALTVSVGQPALAGHVITIDALKGSQRTDAVLARPDCPACSKKAPPPAEDPCLSELESEPRRETDFDRIASTAAGDLCGLIRNLDLVPKVLTEPRQPLIVRAEVANVRFASGEDAFMTCSGKGMDLISARNTALGEALERYASLTWKPALSRRARRAELGPDSLDPRELVLFADDQYGYLPFAPYADDSELDWVPARSLVSDRQVWVPLQGATLGAEHAHGRGLLFAPTSNGFAAGPTLAFAVEHALLEVIERDAFLIAWMHRLETQPYQASTIPDQTVQAVSELYARRGVRIEVHLLPTDSAATVAMAVAWADDAPAAVVGLGAGLDPVDAARGAVLEIGQVRPALVARLGDPVTRERLAELVADPSRVAELEDHDLLYADPGAARRGLAHLRVLPSVPWPDQGGRPRPGLRELVHSLATVAGDVLYLDVTTPDVAALGVKVARGIVPGFQPIHFGADQARLGHPRLFRMPSQHGLRPSPATRADLNLDPHPLA